MQPFLHEPKELGFRSLVVCVRLCDYQGSEKVLNVTFLSLDKREKQFRPWLGLNPDPLRTCTWAPKLQVECANHYTRERVTCYTIVSFQYLAGGKSYEIKIIFSFINSLQLCHKLMEKLNQTYKKVSRNFLMQFKNFNSDYICV